MYLPENEHADPKLEESACWPGAVLGVRILIAGECPKPRSEAYVEAELTAYGKIHKTLGRDLRRNASGREAPRVVAAFDPPCDHAKNNKPAEVFGTKSIKNSFAQLIGFAVGPRWASASKAAPSPPPFPPHPCPPSPPV